MAQGLADMATIAILQHQASVGAQLLNDQLSRALNSRIIIEQAKGMICQSLSCDMVEAFARLRTHARNHNFRLTNVAANLVQGRLRVDELDQPRHDVARQRPNS